jgi:hypothetical protein
MQEILKMLQKIKDLLHFTNKTACKDKRKAESGGDCKGFLMIMSPKNLKFSTQRRNSCIDLS